VPIVEQRRALVEAIAPRAADIFARLTRTGRALVVRYEPALAERGTLPISTPREIEAAMRAQLTDDRRKDHARGATCAGPHTDDLHLGLDGRDAQKYASQGQLRAIVLALKIAEIEHLTERLGDPPILLLDDVSSELDATRNAQLFEFLEDTPGQVFITTTDPAHVRAGAGQRRDVRIASGTLSPPGG
jgi:DNA replication and repair protein RecF